jgi:hypothetical protein
MIVTQKKYKKLTTLRHHNNTSFNYKSEQKTRHITTTGKTRCLPAKHGPSNVQLGPAAQIICICQRPLGTGRSHHVQLASAAQV